MTYQKARLYQYGYWKGFRDIFGYKQSYEIYRFIKGDCFVYFPTQELEGLKKYLVKKLVDKNFILKTVKNLPDKIENNFKNYLKFAKSLPQDFSNSSIKEILNVLEKYYKQENIASINFWILFGNVEVALTVAIKNLMKKNGMEENEVNKLLAKLSEPIKIIPLDREKLSLLKVALLDGKKQKNALRKHGGHFAYLPMYEINYEPYSLGYFKKKLLDTTEKLIKSAIKKEIDDINKKYKERYKHYLKTVKRFQNQKELLYLIKFFAAYGYLKDYKPYIRDQGSFYIRTLFEEIAKRLNLTLEQALFLKEDEIPRLLNKKSPLNVKDLDKRINNSACVCKDDELTFIIDGKMLRKIDEALVKKDKEIKELKGLAVSAGFIRGKVSIILSNNDFSRFKEGEILVASATRPDFVPLMKKAKGIITDEGGMLSHAAIVSRELGKPCVVGTVKGTRVLKNGDLVEVDANKGIIKIIK
jgi:phosphohistidine swiveling domain-containing protein